VKNLWQDETRAECMARARRLTPDSQRVWGKMSVDQMLAHMVDAFRMGLGELPVRSKKLPIRHWPINWLIIHWVPFPRNTPTAPEIVARKKASVDEELRELEAAMNRFAARRGVKEWPEHPAFGAISGNSWARLGYKHVDHHLRQFGV
jgi:uncharacterized protein DUF1569